VELVSAGSALLAGQRAAESLMTVTLAAYSPNGTTVVNDQKVPAFASQGTTRGKVSGQSAQATDPYTRMVTIGEVEVPVLQGGLHIPLSSPIPNEQPGHQWEYVVTALGPVDDPALLGRRYRVVSVPAKSYATARRLDVVEVPGADS
jgi:hypothetical protein